MKELMSVRVKGRLGVDDVADEEGYEDESTLDI